MTSRGVSSNTSPLIPPSQYYLSELGLDYELQNTYLNDGSNAFLFEEALYGDFLGTFCASGEINASSLDKESLKRGKRDIFEHITIPISDSDSFPSNILGHKSLQSIENSSSAVKIFYPQMSSGWNGISAQTNTLDQCACLLSKISKNRNMDEETLLPYDSRDIIDAIPKTHKTVQSAVDDLKERFNLPTELNKLDTLNLFLGLLDRGKRIYGE